MQGIGKFLFARRRIFFLYFILNILFGWVLLSLPVSWDGRTGLYPVDSLFISVSAVCVTGLATVDTSLFSPFGHTVLIFLMQAGGLGIITFTTVYLVFPGVKLPMEGRKMIQSYTVRGSKIVPKIIMIFILVYTFAAEVTGAFFLYFFSGSVPSRESAFNAVFLAVSAFCNAGFTRYNDSLVRYAENPGVCVTVMLLIVLGGIGFMVIWDIFITMACKKKKLYLHTKIMLLMTAVLIFSGAAFFFFAEFSGALSDLSMSGKIISSFFQSVTPRTAGFNTIDQKDLNQASHAVTMFLMFVGAGSGSAAGGIKVSTFFILLLVVTRGLDAGGDIRIFKRRITNADISAASFFFLKALSILLLSCFLLTVSEFFAGKPHSLTEIAFESVSALGTVGLSLGITENLSFGGKIVIIATMFAGRVGLFAFVMQEKKTEYQRFVEFPEAEVLIG